MSETKEVRIWIWQETMWESIVTDTYTIGSLIASVLVGWFIGSAALEWISGILIILMIVNRASGQGFRKLTIDEARKKIDDLERELAQ